MGVMRCICDLLAENVTMVISTSGSTMTSMEADIASTYHVPYFSTVATDPYIKNLERDYLFLMSPSDKYQGQAIFNLLFEYGWYEFSILASADNYGINGMVYLQYLATRESLFSITDVQHFDTTLADQNIGSEANELDLMREGFVWIVTDAITGSPYEMSYSGSYPSYYKGVIGTVPYYGKNSATYNTFTDQYLLKGNTLNDISVTSVLVADALKFAHEALLEADLDDDTSPGVNCKDAGTFEEGPLLRETILNLTATGLSGDMDFAEDGTAITTAYDIMNLKDSGFEKLGSWSELHGLVNSEGKIVDWTKRTDVVYMSPHFCGG
eukprot:sb/3466753/